MRLALKLAACLLVLVVAGLLYARYKVKQMFPPADPARIAAFKASGKPLVDAIEAYRRAHGDYPDDLDAIGKASETAGRENWTYRKKDREDGYVLKVGDYRKDHFVLDWDSRYGDWATDQ